MKDSPKKRINPETGKPFVHGYVREDGYIFRTYRYDRISKSTGLYQELWSSPESYQKSKKNAQKRTQEFTKKRNNEKKYSELKDKRRINPQTGEQFKRGDKQNGMKFWKYGGYLDKDGYVKETWCNEDRFITLTINERCRRTRHKCKRLGIKFDLDSDYLNEIYPQDSMCPLMKVKMEFSHLSSTPITPTIDRINPKKGYTKGNVAWISMKANVWKSDVPVEFFDKIKEYVSEHEQ